MELRKKNTNLLLSTLGTAILIGAVVFSFFTFKDSAQANPQPAPSVHIQYGDEGNSSPSIPPNCEIQPGPQGPSTSDGNDPDCLRVLVTSSSNDKFTEDFQFCLVYSSGNHPVTACTGWASEIGFSDSITAMTPGQNGGNLAGTMTAQVRTRPMTTNMPAGTTFGNVSLGVALAYQKNNGPCLTSSGIAWSSQQTGSWSNWAYGAPKDDDPGCFRAAMRVGEVNSPPDASYVSTTIPQQTTIGEHNNNYKVLMQNRGLTWNLNPSTEVVRPLSGQCSEANFNYINTTVTCTDYVIYSSQRFRLQRTDNSAVSVRSKQLRLNSNDITVSGNGYDYSGPDTVIPTLNSYGQVTTANTIPFYVKQQQTFRRYQGSYEICVPGGPSGPGPGGPGGPGMEQPTTSFQKIKNFFGIKVAQAQQYPDPGGSGDICESFDYNYVLPTYDNYVIDVLSGETAEFAPLNLTVPTGSSAYQLRFRMVDLQNLNTNNSYYSSGRFGEEAIIPINIADAGWTFVCDPTRMVVVGTTANFSVAATVPSGYSSNINVVLQSSSPIGPSLITSPVVLASGNPIPYTGIAQIGTGNLTPQTYNLLFSATDGSITRTCASQLTVFGNYSEVDLKFNDSDGPTTPDPANSGSGTLSWFPRASDTCTGSMILGEDTDGWSGPQSAVNGEDNYFPIKNLQQGQTYEFRILCENSTSSSIDTVQVTVMEDPDPPAPYVDLKCFDSGSPVGSDGPCIVQQGQAGMLKWNSAGVLGCSIDQGIGSVPITHRGLSTGNLNTVGSISFTITCPGPSKNSPTATDTVIYNVVPAPVLPTAPVSVTVNNGITCGVLQIAWSSGTGPAPDGYKVYRRASTFDVWQQLGSNIPYTGRTNYGTTDPNPLSSASNYYGVSSYKNNVESPIVQPSTTPIAVTACSPNISSSDKDVMSVAGRINRTFSPLQCSGASEIATLPNNALFAPGDVITFQINVCNTGTQALSGVNVEDTFTNLSNIVVLPSNPPGCVTGSAVSLSSVNFSLADIPATNGVCAVRLTGVVTSPPDPSAAIYRFQNKGLITANGGISKNVYTPPYLFSVTGGVPDRGETAPQQSGAGSGTR